VRGESKLRNPFASERECTFGKFRNIVDQEQHRSCCVVQSCSEQQRRGAC
jgi:hypothetical protein